MARRQPEYDHRMEYVIDNNSSLGPVFYFGTKSAGAGLRVGQQRISAVALRKLLRFMYTVPDSIQVKLNNWIAVTKSGMDLKKIEPRERKSPFVS